MCSVRRAGQIETASVIKRQTKVAQYIILFWCDGDNILKNKDFIKIKGWVLFYERSIYKRLIFSEICLK